jgi:hypothetical protein
MREAVMNAATIRERPGVLHVFKSGESWRLVREGDSEASVFRTQADAVKSGARLARAEHGMLVIYDQDGRLQATRRYTVRRARAPYQRDGRLTGSRRTPSGS